MTKEGSTLTVTAKGQVTFRERGARIGRWVVLRRWVT